MLRSTNSNLHETGSKHHLKPALPVKSSAKSNKV